MGYNTLQKLHFEVEWALLKFLAPSYNFAKTLEFFNTNYDIYNYVLPLPKPPNKQLFFNKTRFSLKNVILIGIPILLFLYILIAGINNFIYSSIKKVHAQHINGFKQQEKTKIVNLPPRNFSFTGRKEILKGLKTTLNKHNFGVITQAISGLGGVGKTQLALEFAYQAANDNDFSAIFWIPAETSNSTYNAYQEIAQDLKLDAKGLDLENLQNLVHNRLAVLYKKTKILLILDNVPNYGFINNYLAKTHKQLLPHLSTNVLITSRSQHWPEPSVTLDIFTKKEAFRFVQKSLSTANPMAINKLTESLHYFPLALAQAIAYIKQHTNIENYLKLYTAKQKDYLDKFPEDMDQYNGSLWKTWNISLNQLGTRAKELLFISAYLDPDNITLALFDNISIEEKTNAIEELRKYSLITMKNSKSFKIHRLLQEVIRLSIKYNTKDKINNHKYQNDFLKTNDYWILKAIMLINSKFDYDYLQPKKWGKWGKYISHVQAVTINITETSGKAFTEGLKLYIKYALSLTYIQCYEQYAIEAWTKITTLIKTHYKSSKATEFIVAIINSHLSYAHYYSGQFQQAKDILSNVVIPTYKYSLHNINPDERELLDLLRIVPFKNNTSNQERQRCDLNFALIALGCANYRLGLMQEALDLYQKGLEVFHGIKKLNKISQYYKIDTMWTITSRGYIYSGQFIKAEGMFEKAKKGIERLYANHPNQAYAYDNIALLMYHLGEFKETINFLNKCYQIRTANLSSQHIHNAETQSQFGFTNYMLGNITEAINNFTQASTIYKLYYGDDDNNPIYLSPNLGFWKIHEKLGEYDKALHHLKLVLKFAKLRYKDNVNNGMCFQLTEAEIWPTLTTSTNLVYWREALKTSHELFGKNHYQTARYHYMLAQALMHKNITQEANQHCQQALEILNTQEIKHPNLEQIHNKNIIAIQKLTTK